MYDDRLEIYSPGGMMDGSFIQELNLSNISSKRRNPMIADVFSRLHLMERRGSGLKKVLDIYESQEEYDTPLRPEFRSTQTSFFSVLKNLNYGYAERMAVKNGDKRVISLDIKGNGSDSGDIRPAINNNENGDKITIKNEQKKQILVFAEMNLFFKSKDIAELLGLQASRARYLLQELVQEGKIKGIGNNKGRKYQLIK